MGVGAAAGAAERGGGSIAGEKRGFGSGLGERREEKKGRSSGS